MKMMLASTGFLLLCSPLVAAPDTVASVRARAHAEIAARDAQIAALQQKVSQQQKQMDLQQSKLTSVLQEVKAIREAALAAGINVPEVPENVSLSDISANQPSVTPSSEPGLPGFPAGSGPTLVPHPAIAVIPLPYIPPVTAKTYHYIAPPGGVSSALMRFEKIVDRYVKLNPGVIASVVVAHGRVQWVKVVDASRSSSVAYPYDVSVEVGMIYPSDPTIGENAIYRSVERPTFQVNPSTGEIGGQGQF